MRRNRTTRGLAVLAALAVGAASPLAASRLTPEEKRGKQIYLQGASAAGGEVTAMMGDDGLEVPGAALPCASCHGPDGHGRPEGGINPSNVTWEALTKPYGVRHEGGREHPPYTPKDLKKAIAMGFDPAGNKLNAAMPRYRMTIQDMADLIAYMQKIGLDVDPGIDDKSLRLGTVLPALGSGSGAGDAVAAVLRAYFDDVNAAGGVYERQVELVIGRASPSAPSPEATLAALLEEEEVFALVAPMISGDERAVADLVAADGVPTVGPFALFPQVGFPLKREIFYVYPGLATQAKALVEVAQRPADPPPAALVYPAEEAMERVADAVVVAATAAGWESLERRAVPSPSMGVETLVGGLAERGVETVFFFGSGRFASAFFAAAGALGWTPDVYAPGPLLGREAFTAPPVFDGKIFLSFPTLPTDTTPQGLETYRRLASRHPLPDGNQASQISALAAAEVLVEGLKRAGRDLSREQLITALEGLYEHETGLTPPLSFGPNRRIGAQGAYVVAVDLAARSFRPVGDWVEVR